MKAIHNRWSGIVFGSAVGNYKLKYNFETINNYKTHSFIGRRQEINEHIFGTIKRQWGYNHTNLTGLEKVNGEHSLIMLVYNIKRSINILSVLDLIAKLKKWNSPYKAKVLFLIKKEYLKLTNALDFYQTKLVA